MSLVKRAIQTIIRHDRSVTSAPAPAPAPALTDTVALPAVVKNASLFPEVGDPYEKLAEPRVSVHRVTDLQPAVQRPAWQTSPGTATVRATPGRSLSMTLAGLGWSTGQRQVAQAGDALRRVRDTINEVWQGLINLARSSDQRHNLAWGALNHRLDRLEARLDVAEANVRHDVPALTRSVGHALSIHALSVAAAAYLLAQHASVEA